MSKLIFIYLGNSWTRDYVPNEERLKARAEKRAKKITNITYEVSPASERAQMLL